MKLEGNGVWERDTCFFSAFSDGFYESLGTIRKSSFNRFNWNDARSNVYRFRLKLFCLLLFFGDGLRDLCFDEDTKRISESGFRAREPWPRAEPVCSGIGPGQEEKRAVQRLEPNRKTELAAVADRGSESTGQRWTQANVKEEDLWGSTGRWVGLFSTSFKVPTVVVATRSYSTYTPDSSGAPCCLYWPTLGHTVHACYMMKSCSWGQLKTFSRNFLCPTIGVWNGNVLVSGSTVGSNSLFANLLHICGSIHGFICSWEHWATSEDYCE